MTSPFPGMNPYLEQDHIWHDFHGRLCPAVAEFLTPQVRPGYVARIAAGIVLEASACVELPAIDIERFSFVEIRDRQDRRLVTVIELLNPTNKYAGPDWEQYLAKRGQLLASGTHFVEIDLLRGGCRGNGGSLSASKSLAEHGHSRPARYRDRRSKYQPLHP